MKPLRRSSLKKAATAAVSRGTGTKKPRRQVRPGSCARAPSGHAVAAPQSSVMNSRRFSFDHLVGAGEERWRHIEIKLFGRFTIDEKLERGWPLHW